MTSRELLDKILQSPITKAIGGCFMNNDELETIKRDLEVLELLKRELFYEYKCFDLDEGWYDDSFSFSKDEQKKIKEWLESDK